jgi:hypothetical protein
MGTELGTAVYVKRLLSLVSSVTIDGVRIDGRFIGLFNTRLVASFYK